MQSKFATPTWWMCSVIKSVNNVCKSSIKHGATPPAAKIQLHGLRCSLSLELLSTQELHYVRSCQPRSTKNLFRASRVTSITAQLLLMASSTFILIRTALCPTKKILSSSSQFPRLGACQSKTQSLFTIRLTSQVKSLIWTMWFSKRFASVPTVTKTRARLSDTSSSTSMSKIKVL